jgi:hypothetical protein
MESSIILPLIFGGIGIITILLASILAKLRKTPLDYRSIFVVGSMWVAFGFAFKAYILIPRGFLATILGFLHIRDWDRDRIKWDKLNRNQKLIMGFVSVLTFIAFIGGILFWAFESSSESYYCQSFSYTTCPEKCVVCPPCEMCSSVSCQTESYCESIGFNRSWSEEVSKGIPDKN